MTLQTWQFLYRHWPLTFTPGEAREYLRLYRHFRRTFFTPGWQWQGPCFTLLKKIITHAYETVPLYRDKYRDAGIAPDDIRSLADVSLLPYVTRAEVRDAFPYGATSFSVSVDRLMPQRTSGSTGLPLYFFRDRNGELVSRATRRVFQDLAGVPPSARTLFVLSAHSQEEMDDADWIVEEGTVHKLFIDKAPWRDYELIARRIREANPIFIDGLGSRILEIAGIQRKTPFQFCPRLRGIICTADTVTPDDEESLQETFGPGVCVTNRYGSYEFTGNVAQGCPLSRDVLHWNPERHYVEVTDDAGQCVAEGQIGNVLITDLHNFAMPFIRYSIGDTTVAQSLSCGHGWPTIGRIAGRSGAVFVTPDGQRITEQSVGKLFMAGVIPGIVIVIILIATSLLWGLWYPKDAPSAPGAC